MYMYMYVHAYCRLTILDVRVPLSDGDDIGQHGTQPLRVDKVEVAQLAVVIVQQNAVAVQEAGCLVQLIVGHYYLS